MKNIFALSLIFIQFFCFSQKSSKSAIFGTVYSIDSVRSPFATLILYTDSITISVKTDIEGNYKFNNLSNGTYDLENQNVFSSSKKIIKIELIDSIVNLDIYLHEQVIIGCVFGPPKHGYFRGSEHIIRIPLDDIKNIKSSVIIERITIPITNNKNEFDKISIKGARLNDVSFYVDGGRQLNTPFLPKNSIHSITLYSGSIPAKYGDTLGGVVEITTKSYFDLYYNWKNQY